MSKVYKGMVLVFCVLILEAIGSVMGILTQNNMGWYAGLSKSTLTPPGYVFSITWSILYALLAFIGWALWQHPSKNKVTIQLYLAQLIMNWAWTPLFFQLHMIGFSFIWIGIMVCINVVLFIKVKDENKTIAWALIPYLLWLVFATYLNGVIWLKNS